MTADGSELARAFFTFAALVGSAKPMNIRSAKVGQLAQRLARLTGEDVETALERAIEERLSRVIPTVIRIDLHAPSLASRLR